MTKINNNITTLDFRRTDFRLFRDLLHMVSWQTGLEGQGDQKSWVISQENL